MEGAGDGAVEGPAWKEPREPDDTFGICSIISIYSVFGLR